MDVVQYPSDDINDSGNSLIYPESLGRPGFYIEYRAMQGGWYEAAEYYRTRSEQLGEAIENPLPWITPPEAPFPVEPVWTSATLRNGADIPEWVKTCPFFLYISPQVSADNFDFEVPANSGNYPVYNRADAFMDYMFNDTGIQNPLIQDDLDAIEKAVAITWPMKPFTPYGNNDWTGWMIRTMMVIWMSFSNMRVKESNRRRNWS